MAQEKPSSDARRQRLARALKANIGRRKARARAQAAEGTGAEAQEPESAAGAADEESCPN
ncbi:hypothetical protein [Aestuariivirga sp.]|uniref:hypothetical protein n=1 Tax=Aestuariivirga sp. TaxID=2650926 RepID=UPI0035B30BC5